MTHKQLYPLPANLPAYVKKIENAYRMQGTTQSTTDRMVEVNARLWRDHKIDLSKIQWNELQRYLLERQKKSKRNGYRVHCVILKKSLKVIGRDKLAEQIVIPKREDTAKNIQIIPREDIIKLRTKAVTPQSRLIFGLLSESGARRGELWKLLIKHVQFETVAGKETAILWLDGKTGVRRRRLVGPIVGELRDHINRHPHKDDPEFTLLYFEDGYKIGQRMNQHKFYKIVYAESKRLLGHPVYPHLFRHTKATEDSSYYTDREMMGLYGWSRPEQVGTYSHLSMKNVDDKQLAVAGLKKRTESLQPLLTVRTCPQCKTENAPISMYCRKCGSILEAETRTAKQYQAQNKELGERLNQQGQLIEQLTHAIHALQENAKVKEKA